MQLHDLKPRHARFLKKRVGRGGKRGTFSGRGTKGQRARAGHKIRPAERDFIQRLPKLRGVGNRTNGVSQARELMRQRARHRALRMARKTPHGKNS
ncbi:MAG: hypothetical protein M1361_00055 [Patescibacteria group bacterium]|nr:hypothetical protein [Patescibacteria group bacterium]MCL5224012.1 hypothetical protein [Patescibacteria group bacterium]